MDEFDEDAMFEVAAVDAVRVPAPSTSSLQCPPEVRYIYTEKNDTRVRIYYANDCKPHQRARNEQLEWAHTHGMGGPWRVKWTGRSDVRVVRILAIDVVRSMLKHDHHNLLSPANGKIDIMTIKSLLARRYPPKETTGPTSPLDHIIYDAKRGLFVWMKALTPYMWHLQVGDAAFSNLHRGIRALRTNRVDGGDDAKKMTTRVEALKLYGEYGSLGALLAAVQVAREQPASPPAKAIARAATPPPPPSSPAITTTQPRPTTGGKGLVRSTGETPKLTASTAFDPEPESESESGSDVSDDDSATPPEEGRDAEDAIDMDSSDTDGEESEGTADDAAVLLMRRPLEDTEPVLGIKRAADDLCQAYMRKIFEEGRLGPSPEVSRDEDHRLLARGLQAQVYAQIDSIRMIDLQIESYARAIEILKRKREDDRTILGELYVQLQTAKRRCDLPTDEYVLTRAKELKRMRKLTGKSAKTRSTFDASQPVKSVDIL